MKVLLLAFLCLASEAYGARRYMGKCELMMKMKQLGMDGYNGFRLGMWMCLAKYSSRMDTHFQSVDAGRPYYGIFRINGLQWCDNGKNPTQNRCRISCNKFLDYDIQDDVECLKKIVKSQWDMKTWWAYEKVCKHEAVNLYTLGCSRLHEQHEQHEQRITQ